MSNVDPVERFGAHFSFIIAIGTWLQLALFIEEIYMFIIFIGKFWVIDEFIMNNYTVGLWSLS
jgi:hypothetical protein